MSNFLNNLVELNERGFSISSQVFNTSELENISELINSFLEKNNFQKYAIRSLFKNIPKLFEYISSIPGFNHFKDSVLSKDYFLTKSIYFNKPNMSNWFVPYHQDLSISVKNKIENKYYLNWTKKDNIYGVQPPNEILKNTITMRIHLDDTDKNNGALKIIERSHNNGIIRVDESFDSLKYGEEKICNVSEGSIMLMKPLVLHSSEKSISNTNRRVIHIEFCNINIPNKIDWYEKINLN
ncbi:hypothetical protein BFR04_01555 [Gaetbulibacter sp. 4G1]|nr:phytanoyl-CoA dioxygenase family protein [Gaetbulibacter sp. 4G1]PIA79556.1 hypothetical protein BFR04_01555 [Gaetbulibacter sp. 4G1]